MPFCFETSILIVFVLKDTKVWNNLLLSNVKTKVEFFLILLPSQKSLNFSEIRVMRVIIVYCFLWEFQEI